MKSVYKDASAVLEKAWEQFQADPNTEQALKDGDGLIENYFDEGTLVVDVYDEGAGVIRLEAWERTDEGWCELSRITKIR